MFTPTSILIQILLLLIHTLPSLTLSYTSITLTFLILTPLIHTDVLTRILFTQATTKRKRKRKHEVAEASTLARKRKLKQRPSSGPRKKPKRESNVPSEERVRQFEGETLVADGGLLFCEACGLRPLANVKSTISNHVTSESHIANKKLLSSRKEKQSQLSKYFSQLADEENRSAPVAQQVRRFQVVSALMEGAIPLNKLEILSFRNLLEDR